MGTAVGEGCVVGDGIGVGGAFCLAVTGGGVGVAGGAMGVGVTAVFSTKPESANNDCAASGLGTVGKIAAPVGGTPNFCNGWGSRAR